MFVGEFGIGDRAGDIRPISSRGGQVCFRLTLKGVNALHSSADAVGIGRKKVGVGPMDRGAFAGFDE